MGKIPQVAVIGRPNVGKSTLFNRLIGQKKSIVADMPGVTRDRVFGDVEYDGVCYRLIDTGGIVLENETEIEIGIRRQIEIATIEADCVILLCDRKVGVTEDDVRIAREFQKKGIEIVLTVNKVDSSEWIAQSAEFYSLGFKRTVFISGMSGFNIDTLLDAVNEVIRPLYNQIEQNIDAVSVAILGRPNVGKSSLINRLTGNEISIVSNVPGTTRDAVDTFVKYHGKQIRLIDTAGLRRKTKVKDQIEYYSSLRSIRHLEQCDLALMMIDAKEGLTAKDLEIISTIEHQRKGMILLINKWDILPEKNEKSFDHFKKRLIEKHSLLQYFPILSISAIQNQRLNKIYDLIIKVYNQYQKRYQTSFLNSVVKKMTTHYPAPAYRGKEIKFYYTTQVNSSPPHIVLFSNYPEHLRENYTKYMLSQFYQQLNIQGVFLKVSYKKRQSIEMDS